ncbi:hypothetical protein C4569_02375 [Candidatus Parcubacteria bacterium]|nr:MAG: hypothetical protein C4569_02375 [Candidatus Parcubacteria bacterium]
MHPKIKQLIFTPSNKPSTCCGFFNGSQNNNLARSNGYLFGLFEYESNFPEALGLLEKLLARASELYYQKLGSSQSALTAERCEEALSQALQEANVFFLQLLNSSSIIFDTDKANIAFILIREKDVFLAYAGRINVFLVRCADGLDCKMVNVLSSVAPETDESDPLSIFSQIVTGKILSDDLFFLATNSVLDFLSLQKIKNIISLNNQEQAAAEIKKLLEEVNCDLTFGFLIVKEENLYPAIKFGTEFSSDIKTSVQRDSMRELIMTQQSTQKILNTKYLPDLEKLMDKFKNSFFYYLDFAKKAELPKIKLPARLNKPKEKIAVLNLPLAAGRKLLNFPGSVLSVSRKIFSKISFLPSLIPSGFSKRNKILFSLLFIFLFLFLGNLIVNGIKNNNKNNKVLLEKTAVDIQKKIDEAKSSMVYGDESKARSDLIDAKKMIADSSDKIKTAETIANLSEEIELQLGKLRHLVSIAEPVMLLNSKNINENSSLSPVIVMAGNKLYTHDKYNQSLIIFDLSNRNISTVYQAAPKINNPLAAAVFNDKSLLFFNENKKFSRLAPDTNETDEMNFSLPSGINPLQIDEYNQRLYILGQNNIYRSTYANKNIGEPSAWLKEKADLKNIVSFAVDGHIYLLENNGQIHKYLNGKKNNVFPNKIDPEFISPAKVHSPINSKYLYILDPPTKRLVVTDKEGNLVIQFTSPVFSGLKDFAVSEKEKKIYLLDGNSVYAIRASHLE